MFCSIFNYKWRKNQYLQNLSEFFFLKPTFQSTGVAILYFWVSWRDSITLIISLQLKVWNFSDFYTDDKRRFTKFDNSYSKLRPVVAGYKIDSRIFLAGSIMNTARADMGKPVRLSISAGSNIPNIVASFLVWSSIIGYGNSSSVTSP